MTTTRWDGCEEAHHECALHMPQQAQAELNRLRQATPTESASQDYPAPRASYHILHESNSTEQSTQHQVAQAVAARGYAAGFTRQQLVARQVCKLLEELAELAGGVVWPNNNPFRLLHARLADVADLARMLFDSPGVWDGADYDAETVTTEAADCQVVLFFLAETLGIDLQADALNKARADVARGRRDGDDHA